MNMPFKVFQKISYDFGYTNLVYLSGWGEPLLNPRIYDMINIAKDCGCSVGFTTNGLLLTEKRAKSLIQAGLDILSISVAGATKETHETIRAGSSFDQTVKNITSLVRLKKNAGVVYPKVLLLFLMTKENLKELPLAVRLAADLEVDEIVATNLAYVVTPYHDQIKAFSHEREELELEKIIGEAERLAKNLDVKFRSSQLITEEALICEEDPLHNVYVSCEGFVSPCVYLNPPVKDFFPRIFCGRKHVLPRTYFGKIREEGLLEIWKKEEYQAFRRKFEKRLTLKEMIFRFEDLERFREEMISSPLPEPCKTCYKAFSV